LALNARRLRENPRTSRLRSPLLLALWVLLAVEAMGGLWIFGARLAFGTRPGETLHILVGVPFTVVYAVYQWRHWSRVRPFRPQLDYAMGALAATFMALTNLTGLVLAAGWWHARVGPASQLGEAASGPVSYPPLLSAAHDIGSMVVLAFVGAHLGAVLMRDRRGV
jgi:hypothetical protein